MGYGSHKVPQPLADEDRWIKLTKRQWVIVLPIIILSLVSLKVTWDIGILPVGIALTVILGMAGYCIACEELPDDKYLFGSRIKLEILGLRLVWKKMPWNKTIYTKNYDNGYKEWMEK